MDEIKSTRDEEKPVKRKIHNAQDNEIEQLEHWNATDGLKSTQMETLRKCGYSDVSSCNNEQLRDFIQAETLKSIITIKIILITFLACSIAVGFIYGIVLASSNM